jgi:LmbE family N-acetylglucosaminyl deacetylase
MSTAPVPTGSVLGIWAHPDDEAYLSAGLMATARRAGHRVAVVTATWGEHGTDDPGTWPPARLARLRERELTESLRAVGVREHLCLGYADGSLAATDRRPAVATLHRMIEENRPDTIVTFGPDGMTGHDDHRTISSWVTEAWRRSGTRTALWYATLTPQFHAAWGALNEEVGLWFAGSQPPVTPVPDLAAQLVCSGGLLDRKHRALRAHASQTRALEELVGAETYRSWWSTESFVAAERAVSRRSSAQAGRGRPGSTYAGRRSLRRSASA